MKLLLRFLGEGKFVCATGPDIRETAKLAPRTVFWCDLKPPRSVRQNKFIHAIFEWAWINQRVERWETPEQLKAAAFCAVGHCDIYEWPKANIGDIDVFLDLVAGLAKRIGGTNTYPQFADRGSYVELRTARPWRFDALEHEDATHITQKVLDWLCSDQGPCPGLDPEELRNQAKGDVKDVQGQT